MGLAHLCMVLSVDLSGAASLYGDLFTVKWNTMLATELLYTTVHIIAHVTVHITLHITVHITVDITVHITAHYGGLTGCSGE